jgi:hypothetical protein
MGSSDGIGWLSGLMILLFLSLLYLRIRFHSASKRAETAALVVTTFLFFSIWYVFLPH